MKNWQKSYCLLTIQAKDMYLKTLDKSLSCSDGREYVLRNYLEQIPEHAEVRAIMETVPRWGKWLEMGAFCGVGMMCLLKCNFCPLEDGVYYNINSLEGGIK